MTCIAAVTNSKKVWIGGDSAGTDASNLNRIIVAEPKVFVNGNMIFGFAGSFKSMQVTRRLQIPEQNGGSDFDYVSSTFIDAFQKNLTERGDGSFEGFPGECLMGYRGNIYEIHSNFQVIRARCSYAAIGSGGTYALGSLHSSSGRPEGRVRKALESAANHNAGVAEPFVILSGGLS